jgi:subfamily B ATP-binding cassette protein MsbA
MEERERKEFIRESSDFLSKEKKFVRIKAVNTPFLELIGFMAVLGVLAIGGYQILTGGLVLGDLVTFATSLALISAPIQNVSKGFLYIKQASASADRIFSLMDEEKETVNEKDKPDMPFIKGDIRFENVYFSYSGKDKDNVLNGIKISIKEKETLAVVGLSGGGKTTLVKLIPRLIKPTSGGIKIDNNDIAKHNLKSLREQISMVTQDIMLFHGTIAENIRYGKPHADDDEIIEASKIANAYDFIMELPERFSTQIGEKGMRLSGGQKQRISLARALVRKPQILILDEATSSLDTESERAIQSAFMKINHKQTTIVIAHRLSTIINSDRIIVIEDGRITESGTHKQLIQNEGTYKRLYDLQFKMPDMEN